MRKTVTASVSERLATRLATCRDRRSLRIGKSFLSIVAVGFSIWGVYLEQSCAQAEQAREGIAPANHAPRVTERPPESARVDIFPPGPVVINDIEQLVWLSGASDGAALQSVRGWATMLIELDPVWIADAFDSLQDHARDYTRSYAGSMDFSIKARALESLMKARDMRAAQVFAKERELLETILAREGVSPDDQGKLIERLSLARRVGSVEFGSCFSVHMVPDVLGLLRAAALDRRTSEDARGAIRTLALENISSTLGAQHDLLVACLASGFRGNAELARSVDRGELPRGSMARVFRPIAHMATSLAVRNREILALARQKLPPEVADELESEFRNQTYGPLAADLFSFERLESLLFNLIGTDARTWTAEVMSDRLRRHAESRDRILRLFDREANEYLERGLLRDPEGSARFAEALLKYQESGMRDAVGVIALLAQAAQANPAWDQVAFDAELAEWKTQSQRRVRNLIDSGILSTIAPSDLFR